jgi:hypothetical protein
LGSLSLQENVRIREQRVRLAQERVRLAEERIRLSERAFFIQTKREDEKEKQRRLQVHYEDLKTTFSFWSGLADFQTEMTGVGRSHPRDITYPNAWTQIQGTDNFHIWALEHVKSGYPELQVNLDRLKALESVYYRDTFVLAVTIENELDGVLKTFHDLSPRSPSLQANYYVRDQMLHAVLALDIALVSSVSSPEATDQKSLSLESGYEIARGSSAALERLLGEIGKLRTLHQSDLEALKASLEEHTQLVLAIKKKAAEIVQEDIEYLERLKGECALCKRFS